MSSFNTRISRFEEPAYAALRIVSGLMFALHGAQKLFGAFGAKAMEFSGNEQLYIGGVIELVAGLLIAIGLFTRPAAFLASGTMAVAYFQFHWKLKFAENAWVPLVNQGEMAVLYCFVFLFFFVRGAGALSVDRKSRGV
jgi:putative oxidoreductase